MLCAAIERGHRTGYGAGESYADDERENFNRAEQDRRGYQSAEDQIRIFTSPRIQARKKD